MSPDALSVEARLGSGVYAPRGLTIVEGQGTMVRDNAGREYLDATAGYGVAPLGHSHPAVVEAIRAQAGRLVNCQGIFSNNERAKYLEELEPHLPARPARIFLCNSGTEAVEAALKFSRAATGRLAIVALRGAFHGRTFGALSATWNPKYREPFQPLVPEFQHVSLEDPTALDRALTDNTAGLIVEIVQGEGGVRPIPPDDLHRASRLCQERGVMLIVDEVQTGFGRTGSLFACDAIGLAPDFLCLGKGIAGGFPMGATAIGPRVPKLAAHIHGSTFGGNPLACAAARATLRTLINEDIAAKAARKGKATMERLRALNLPVIREVRGVGLMIGIDLRVRAQGALKALQEQGLLALAAGPTVIRLLPTLTITEDELDRIVQTLRDVLSNLTGDPQEQGSEAS